MGSGGKVCQERQVALFSLIVVNRGSCVDVHVHQYYTQTAHHHHATFQASRFVFHDSPRPDPQGLLDRRKPPRTLILSHLIRREKSHIASPSSSPFIDDGAAAQLCTSQTLHLSVPSGFIRGFGWGLDTCTYWLGASLTDLYGMSSVIVCSTNTAESFQCLGCLNHGGAAFSHATHLQWPAILFPSMYPVTLD